MKEALQILRIAREVVSGTFEPPPRMVDDITAWIVALIAYRERIRLEMKLELYEEHDWTGFDPDDFRIMPGFMTMGDSLKIKKPGDIKVLMSEMKSSIRYLKGLISASPKEVKAVYKKWTKTFKVDLTGWKYASKYKSAPLEVQKKARKIYPSVKVEMNMKESDSTAGTWHRMDRKLTVFVSEYRGQGLAERDKSVIRDIRRTVAHEMRHFSQDYLGILVGNWGAAGLPSKKIRTPDVNQNLTRGRKYGVPESVQKVIDRLEKQGITKDVFHSMDDVEFYTKIADTIETISEKLDGYDRADRKDAFMSYVGGKRMDGAPPREFMTSLKSFARGKWQKAVKEIAKAVL